MTENLESQTDKKNEFVPASFIKRFAAAFGEHLLILSIPSVLFILSYILSELRVMIFLGILLSLFYNASALVIIIMIIIMTSFFYVYFEKSHYQATPFKILLGLHVFNVDGTEAELPQLVHRAILKNIIVIVIAILFLNFLNMPDYSGWYFLIPIFIIILYNLAGISGWFPFKIEGQALHDQLAGTIVLQKTFFKNKVSIFSMVLIPLILFLLTFNIFFMWSRPWLNIAIIPSCFNGTWIYRLGVEEYRYESLKMIKLTIYSLEEIVKKYSESNGGVYPKNLHELSGTSYWKNFNNSYCNDMSGIGGALMDYEEYQKIKFHDKHRGFILYKSVGNPPKRYFIYGCDIKGDLIYYYHLPHKYYEVLDLKKESLLGQLFPFLIFDISYLR